MCLTDVFQYFHTKIQERLTVLPQIYKINQLHNHGSQQIIVCCSTALLFCYHIHPTKVPNLLGDNKILFPPE